MEIQDIKLAVLMPHRNDRPQFLEQFHKQLNRQTFQPTIVEIVNYPPINEDCDITARYRTGYDKLRNKGLDIVAFMEIDDIYMPNYLEVMLKAWIEYGLPEIFGTNYTIYYNLKLQAHFTMNHTRRSSMMSTLMKPDLVVDWGPDVNPYTDSYLWLHNQNLATFKPDELICLGLKGHGIGKPGGAFHNDKLERYIDKTIDLQKIMSPEDYNFYKGMLEVLPTERRYTNSGYTTVFKS